MAIITRRILTTQQEQALIDAQYEVAVQLTHELGLSIYDWQSCMQGYTFFRRVTNKVYRTDGLSDTDRVKIMRRLKADSGWEDGPNAEVLFPNPDPDTIRMQSWAKAKDIVRGGGRNAAGNVVEEQDDLPAQDPEFIADISATYQAQLQTAIDRESEDGPVMFHGNYVEDSQENPG